MNLTDDQLPAYLARLGLLAQPERARVEPAGDGNINYVRRVRLEGQSWIVKQARAALEKFPEYQVTRERIVFEQRFNSVVLELLPERASSIPGILNFDPENFVIVMQDLGDDRLSESLAAGRAPALALRRLGAFLAEVHRVTRPIASELAPQFRNEEMRELHGEHIFSLPYEPEAFPLAPAVRKAADALLARPGIRSVILELRTRYYGSETALVHADAQAGNVLLDAAQPRLIDAEIAHIGDPAFDLGTALAHVLIPLDSADLADALITGYLESGGTSEELAWARRYAGVEMLRRTIGAARHPALEAPAAAEAGLSRASVLLLS